MIISLLGPTFGIDKEEIKVIGKDIMISVDLSESMNANDIQPSRLEKIKFEKKIVNYFFFRLFKSTYLYVRKLKN